MANTAAAPETPAAKPKQTRVSAENRYVLYDIEESLVVADTVKNRGGNLCSPEQLGGFLDYKSTAGGAFAQRVAAAKAFGFIETNQGKYRITPRGEIALSPVYPGDRERALRDAFLSVPVFRRVYEAHKGRSLPQGLGMQNYMRQTFGIPPGKVLASAVRTLMACAQQAGFFAATSGQQTHLIEPTIGDVNAPRDPEPVQSLPNESGGGSGGSGHGGGRTGMGAHGPVSRGTLLDGVWELLPDADTWTEDLMVDWRDMLEMAIRVRYKLPKPSRTKVSDGGDA
jgi:hypothetical protein